jgi:hypothetical protein
MDHSVKYEDVIKSVWGDDWMLSQEYLTHHLTRSQAKSGK